MKTRKNILRAVLLLAVLSVGIGVLGACSAGSKLKGNWELTSGEHSIGYLQLDSDGTCVVTASKDETEGEKGYWEITEDGKLEITGSIAGQFLFFGNIKGAYTLSGKTLTVEDAKKGTLVFTRD